MNRINIDWTDLSHAFESGSSEVRFFFDRQTGKVITLTDETLHYAETPPYNPLPDWMQNAVWEAAQVRDDCGKRYIPIPTADTADEYRDLEAFISTVNSPAVQSQLWRAIRGSGAFHRFKEALLEHPSERQRWFAYREGRTLARMTQWLASIDIEPANPLQPPTVPGSEGQEPLDEQAERQELIEELTLLLLHLCSWEENMLPDQNVIKAWKGYTFDTLNALEDRGLIHQSRKAKSVTLTEEGIQLARELEMRFKP
ncbi:MAG TPA: DUF6429 family protein [Anaerolineae bacterium]